MTISTPCQLCGMCEYGYGCEDDKIKKPLCFYSLMRLEDELVDLDLSDDQIDAVTDVVRSWLNNSAT